MKRCKQFKILSIIFFLLFILNPVYAVQGVKLKLGTLAPKGTVPAVLFHMLNDYFRYSARRVGIEFKIVSYYGGVMGDDPQMIQRAKTGQLDLITPTVNGIPVITKEMEVFYMAYLIYNYGVFDYIVRKNARFINNLLYDKGWVSIALIFSEGAHNLYMHKPYRTINDLRKNLMCGNISGGGDSTFYKAHKIPQIPFQPNNIHIGIRSNVLNAIILPSLFVIGMQIYTAFPYFVEPPIRISTTTAILTRKKYKTLPLDMKIFMIAMQPLTYYLASNIMRDAANAYKEAMLKYGCKKIELTSEELKKWRDPVIAYRKNYLGDDKAKQRVYSMLLKSVNEYNSGNPIEKTIYNANPTYSKFPDKMKRIYKALKIYYRNGNKKEILKLTKDKILEKWRCYDFIVACEKYIKTGSPEKLKKWMKSFYITDVVDELFSNDIDSVKKIYGTKKAFRGRIDEFIFFFKESLKYYKGYQNILLKKNIK